MTTDELRDWHAREAGWLPPGTELVRRDGTTFSVAAWTRRQRDGQYEHNGYDDGGTRSKQVAVPVHPYPPTLDGAAAAMPEGWTWGRDETEWWATRSCTREIPSCVNTGVEIHDRYLLAKLAKETMNANPRRNLPPRL